MGKISGVPHVIPHRIHINGSDTGEIQLRVRGASGQTVNIVEVQNSAGTSLLTVDNDGDVSIAGNIDAVVNETLTGNITLSGNLTVNGNSTLGNASGDTLTVNATSTFAAGVTFSSTSTFNGTARFNVPTSATAHYLRRQTPAPSANNDNGAIYTSTGDAGTTELFYLDAAGNSVQITDVGALEGASLFWDDDEYIRMGNTAASPDIRIGWNTAQTVDGFYVGLSDGQNTFVIAENGDRAFDFAHGAQTNPTVFIHSASQSTTQWLSLAHNQTNAVISTGVGSITFTPAGAGIVLTQTAGTTGVPTAFTITGAAHTGLTAATEDIGANLNFSATKTWAAGAGPLATQREVLFQAPTYAGNAGGALTITDAATVAITGGAVEGANMTITNSHALLIQAGAVSTAGASYGLTVNAQTGATNNYAAQFLGGNVGIGTATPEATLDVVGSAYFDGSIVVDRVGGDNTNALQVIARAAGASSNFGNPAGNGAMEFSATSTLPGIIFGTLGAYPVILGTNNVARFWIDSAGKVGIGATTPTHFFQITAGTLASTIRGLYLSATFTDAAAGQVAADLQVTTAGTLNTSMTGLDIRMLAGYTGTAYSYGANISTAVAATSADWISAAANIGVLQQSLATTVGDNVGNWSRAYGGNVNIGVAAQAITAKVGATNIGVIGLGQNTGGGGAIQIGGYFGLNATEPTFASAALMADNSDQTSDIFVARDNGTAVFTIADGGLMTVNPVTTGVLMNFVPETEWTSGTVLNVDFGSATTQAGNYLGIVLDFNTNQTGVTDQDITGYQLTTPALTQTAANTTTYIGYNLPTAGALIQNTAVGTIAWRGINLQLPNITQTTGTVTSYGIYINGGTVTSGTELAIFVDLGTVRFDGILQQNDAIYFTQTDGNEKIDSAADGYVDYTVTTAHRFNMSAADTDVRLEFIGTTSSGLLEWMEDEDYFRFTDSILLSGNIIEKQGADIASGSTIVIPKDGNTFELTGVTAVNLITSTGFQDGFRVTLIANESVTINNGAATSGADITILLAAAGNFAMTANDTLTLVLSTTTAGGQAWREVSRTVI